MDSSLSSIFIIILLLAANGFFVAAEFALVKVRPFRIEVLAAEGGASARLTLKIHADLEAYLAACQLGITMASLGLGWVGEPAVAAILEPLFQKLGLSEQVLHTSAFLIGFIIFSSLHIVIGEQVPKAFAIRKAEPVSLAIAYPLRWFYLICYPLNRLLNWAASAILRAFKVPEVTHAEVLSDAELRGLIDVSTEHGEMHEDKAQMLHNLFEFDQRPVATIMVSRQDIDCLDLAATPEANARVMQETQHSRLPVIDNSFDKPVGILLIRDLYHAVLEGEETPWRDLRRFCREPLLIPEQKGIGQLFDTMRKTRKHMALIMDEYGMLVGLVTLEDLLEEIVGEIDDELDIEGSGHGIHGDGDAWIADGLTPLADVTRVCGLQVDQSAGVNTLSGLFMRTLERMPKSGDTIVVDRFRLSVTEMKNRHVEKVRIEHAISDAEAGGDTGTNDPLSKSKSAGDDASSKSS